MFGHLPELLIIMVVGLIFFGPEKLPEVAANAGRMIRDVRQAFDTAMNPAESADVEPDDFTQYYYESLARSGETMPETPQDDDDYVHVWHDAATENESEPDSGAAPVSEISSVAEPKQPTATSVSDSPAGPQSSPPAAS